MKRTRKYKIIINDILTKNLQQFFSLLAKMENDGQREKEIEIEIYKKQSKGEKTI